MWAVPGLEVDPDGQTRLPLGLWHVDGHRAGDDLHRGGVDVHDGKLTLHGNVHTWAQVQEAQRAAWCVPGVTEVDNRLKVVP